MKSWRNERTIYRDSERFYEEQTRAMLEELTPMPDTVRNWLSQLILLGEVPLAYLVTDERELPMESIRFFHMDPGWVQSLTDGAFSIGALTKVEAIRSMSCMPGLFERAKAGVRLSRYGRMHPNHLRETMRLTNDSDIPLSGFLLRSALVSNWKGIEVKGFTGDTQLDILRMETLSDKILICIFEGQIDSVRMYEPKEVLHFGTRDSKRILDVRRIDEGHEGEPLYQEGTTDKVSITVPTTDKGRVQVTELRESLSKALKTNTEAVESPQLALEMLSVAGQCVFERGN